MGNHHARADEEVAESAAGRCHQGFDRSPSFRRRTLSSTGKIPAVRQRSSGPMSWLRTRWLERMWECSRMRTRVARPPSRSVNGNDKRHSVLISASADCPFTQNLCDVHFSADVRMNARTKETAVCEKRCVLLIRAPEGCFGTSLWFLSSRKPVPSGSGSASTACVWLPVVSELRIC